jgi:hypothetical protein
MQLSPFAFLTKYMRQDGMDYIIFCLSSLLHLHVSLICRCIADLEPTEAPYVEASTSACSCLEKHITWCYIPVFDIELFHFLGSSKHSN